MVDLKQVKSYNGAGTFKGHQRLDGMRKGGGKDMKKKGLTNNQLKMVAMIAMTCDHVGVMLFPQATALRLIGRLAFPVYGYMIGEGCRHTGNMPKYLGMLAALAVLCQSVYFFAVGSVYQCVIVTFTLSVICILLLKNAMDRGTGVAWMLAGAGFLLVFFVTEVLPGILVGMDFGVDYGFWGVLLPVGVYFGKDRRQRLGFAALILVLLSLGAWRGQWFSLLSLPLLWLYNGRRGKWSIKWLFYFYYPAHLVAIQVIAWISK